MNWLTVLFDILLAIGLLLTLYGIKNKSQLSVFFGVTAFLAPIFYFIGWTSLLPLVPPCALVISFLVKK
jgi:hypothetical protein